MFTPTLTFVALDKDFIEHVNQKFIGVPNVLESVLDITKLRSTAKQTAFVSPANSLLFMDGGIDRAYSRTMWPGIESICKDRLKRLGNLDFIDRPFLPIGSAIVVADPTLSQWLVCAPTTRECREEHHTNWVLINFLYTPTFAASVTRSKTIHSYATHTHITRWSWPKDWSAWRPN
jgi:hypothetical protein